jgi:hypothetical protein
MKYTSARNYIDIYFFFPYLRMLSISPVTYVEWEGGSE